LENATKRRKNTLCTLIDGNCRRLSGSVGQADAGTMSGGTLRLSGGYWVPPVAGGAPGPQQYRVVLPTILGGP